MSKKDRNWKVILNTNNYHSVFIRNNQNDDALMLLYKYWDEISSIEDYVMLVPTLQERKEYDISNYLKKFAPILKSFIDDKNKSTLIAEESVLNALLKHDKRENFFKFLIKQKKNIILFCNSNYEEYIINIPKPYSCLILEYDDWVNSVEVFDRFSDIKEAVAKTYNPFKNPNLAFKKYIAEKD
jgi:hypothetical protein